MACNIQTFLPDHVIKLCPHESKLSSSTMKKYYSTVCLLNRLPGSTGLMIVRNQSMTKSLVEADHHFRLKVLGSGKFGKFGGEFVPETLMTCLKQLEVEFNSLLKDSVFQERDYVGRETPLYFAKRLTDYYKNDNGEGPEIYLKREDLNHVGAHKINNAIAQAMIAKRMGCKSVVAATGAGQHGIATAAACAKLSLECTIFMGTIDMEKRSSNVFLMKLSAAQVKPVEGSFKEASSEAIRNWVGNLESSYYLQGTADGPHPCPSMVREFQSVIGKETRRQAIKMGREARCVGCMCREWIKCSRTVSFFQY